MKKILSIVLIFAICLSMIATPVFAQITYEKKDSAPSEESAASEESADDLNSDDDIDDEPVTEAEIANARMMLNMVATYIAEFDPAELYADLSEIVKFSDTFDFWKDDMTAELKNIIFGELKASLADFENSTFLEDIVREGLKDEEGKAGLASAGLKQTGDNTFDVMGMMTMKIEGNAYIYSDATGKVFQKLSFAAGPDPDSVYITFESTAGEEPVVAELLAKLGDDVINVSTKEDGSSTFEPRYDIDFTETNQISIVQLDDGEKSTIQFIPEDYRMTITTPESTDETGEIIEKQVIDVEINPENKSFGIVSNGEEALTAYFYPEEKEITMVSPYLADFTASLTGDMSESLTFKFDDDEASLTILSGKEPAASLVFNQANSSIDLSVAAGEMGMMSGISLAVNPAELNVVFSFMGLEMFNLTVDTAAETATIISVDMMTESKVTEVLTLEDIVKMLRNQTAAETMIVE